MLKKISLVILGFTFLIGLGFAIRYFSASSADRISTAPLFDSQLLDTTGKTQSFSQYKGKIIVLNFWATWCPPCREEMPALSTFYSHYQNKNVVVLGIAMDELSAVKDFLKTSNVSYPVFIADNDHIDLSNQLGNDQDILPYTIIIDRHGKVIKTMMGRINQSALETAIKPLLTN